MDFGAVFNNLRLPVIVCDAADYSIKYISAEARGLLCAEAGSVLRDCINPKTEREYDVLIETLRDASYIADYRLTVLTPGGEADISVSGNTVDGHYCLYIKPAETEVDRVVCAMERAIDNIEAMVFVTDIKTCDVVYMNRAMARERGIKDREKEKIRCAGMFMRDTAVPCEVCRCKPLLANGKPTGETVSTEFKSTINNKWYVITTTIVEWINGEYVYLNSAVEITARKHNEDNLRKSASTDAMTGVFNREWGYKALDKMIIESNVMEGSSSVVFIDIDGLKAINDTYGHVEGDKIIVGVVDALKKSTRKNDIISRWGGDEFVVMLPSCTRQNAESVMKNAVSVLDEMNKSSADPYKYSFSYGIYEIAGGKSVINAETVIKAADSLMYEQKNKKKMLMG